MFLENKLTFAESQSESQSSQKSSPKKDTKTPLLVGQNSNSCEVKIESSVCSHTPSKCELNIDEDQAEPVLVNKPELKVDNVNETKPISAKNSEPDEFSTPAYGQS